MASFAESGDNPYSCRWTFGDRGTLLGICRDGDSVDWSGCDPHLVAAEARINGWTGEPKDKYLELVKARR
jgi:hypothetical protein